ncbi:MAG: type II toxin-antitoxin system HicA family toxin [bacterium]|nr:type II toxin-antitoxin system HicA family toxin [bacterium]
MPKPIELKIVVRVLKNKGFFFYSQKGSHAKYKKSGNPTLTVIVKMSKKEIPYGTFTSIIQMSGISEEEFREK